MKGIILSGGLGHRLFPMTVCVNKQLLPIYDKPMIYYPLSTLISLGVSEVCLISSPDFIEQYKKLLFYSNLLGIKIDFRTQEKPNGIAEAFLIAEDFIYKDSTCLILGDNIFDGKINLKNYKDGALIFAYEVVDPERYGVVEFDHLGNVVSIEEKPKNPKSKYAITGLYVYDSNVCKYAKKLTPSKRGELEITDLNRIYLENKKLKVSVMEKNLIWLDAGTPESLFEAICYVKTVQSRKGKKIGCIEEEVLSKNKINKKMFKNYLSHIPSSEYKNYLEKIL